MLRRMTLLMTPLALGLTACITNPQARLDFPADFGGGPEAGELITVHYQDPVTSEMKTISGEAATGSFNYLVIEHQGGEIWINRDHVFTIEKAID